MDTGNRSRNKASKSPRQIAPTPPQVVTLADGKEYTLAPLDLNMLVLFEEQFPEGALQELINSGKLTYLRHLIYLMLKGRYTHLTEDAVGKLLTLKVLGKIELDLGA